MPPSSLLSHTNLCTALLAASLTRDDKSAPTNPGVSLATFLNDISGAKRRFLDNTVNILESYNNTT